MSEPPRVRQVGDRALLLELCDSTAALAAAEAARAHWGDQLQDVVPGHRTVLLAWDRQELSVGEVMSFLEQAGAFADRSGDDDAPAKARITIPVVYDGADLDDVARRLAVTRERVVELHTASEYQVAFVGFVPGFPYLIGGDPLLDVPRLQTPRTEVPAGSVAVAAGYCGIYPRAAPGGWNLLGRTELELFDVERDPPALLAPGTRVRFEAVGR